MTEKNQEMISISDLSNERALREKMKQHGEEEYACEFVRMVQEKYSIGAMAKGWYQRKRGKKRMTNGRVPCEICWMGLFVGNASEELWIQVVS